MPDLEKVIKGLEICTKDIPMSNAVHKSDFCKGCPYYNAENRYCWNQIVMMRDALALLKEQELDIKALKNTIKNIVEGLMIAGDRIVDVVRCKDCKKRETMYCPFYWRYKGTKYDDWFCADGERRGSE